MLSRKDNNVFKIPCIVFCIIFLIAGLFFLYEGIETYREQTIQQDWSEAEAFVTEVSPRQESRGFGKRRTTKTVYDVEYIFDVPPMDTYYGTLKGSAKYYDTGDALAIKYDPDDPNKSTTILYPDKEALIINTILSVGFVLVGVVLVITMTYAKNKSKEKENNLKERKQYSKIDPSLRGYPFKLIVMAIIYNLLNGGAGIIALVGAAFVIFAVFAKGLAIFI